MRGQLSLEFMMYIVVGTLALSGMLYVYTQKSGWMRSSMQTSYMEDFIAEVNSNVGYSMAKFSTFVPEGLCGAYPDGSSIVEGGPMHLDSGVVISNSVCDAEGRVSNITMTRFRNGTYEISE